MVAIRYLVKFSDGDVGMRTRSEPLEVGDELDDCGEHYDVVKVEQPTSVGGFGRASVDRHAPASARRSSDVPLLAHTRRSRWT